MSVTPLAVVVFFAAMLVSGALVPLLVRFAVGRNLMDLPNTRSSHKVPTPRLGGVAVIAGAWVGVALSGGSGGASLPIAVGATVVGGVGLLDDFMDLHFGVKAAVQAVVALGLLLVAPPPLLSGEAGVLPVLLVPVGVFWIVALCNAFNFMDGIDGITGGVAVICAVFIASSATVTSGLLVALAGAMVGFLVWNLSPATIFMGDAGSYFTGFALAAAVLYAPGAGLAGGFVAVVAGAMVFVPYLMDTAFTIVRRLGRGAGRGIFSAHREHIYQRITPEPEMHRRTSNVYYALTIFCGFASLVAAGGGFVSLMAGLSMCLVCCAVMVALPGLVRTESRGDGGTL